MTSYVRALYEFSGEPGTSEISVAVGEVLQVMRTDVGEGWWEGKNASGDIGLFPAAYVEVMSAAEVKQQQQTPVSSDRYDPTADDDDDWDDDWDEDNDTYSEIGPSNSSSKIHERQVSHLTNSYENKNLPATPNDDILVPASLSGNNNASSTLKKSSMFGKSSDSFILGPGSKDKLPDNELVHIIPLDNFYQWQPNYQSYSVVVASPKKESKFKGMKTYIAYQLTPSFNNISVSIRNVLFDIK